MRAKPQQPRIHLPKYRLGFVKSAVLRAIVLTSAANVERHISNYCRWEVTSNWRRSVIGWWGSAIA
jgi:hypothetical protein